MVPVAAFIAWGADRIDVTQASGVARLGLFGLAPAALLVLTLAPGLAASTWVRSSDPVTQVVVATATSAVAGGATFWIWFWDPGVGRWWSMGLCLASAGVSVLRRRNGLGSQALGAVGLAALVATAAVSLSALDASTGRGLSAAAINEKLWKVEDNRLPEYLADRVIDGPPLNESPLHGDWRSSDRPPLQTGMYLVVHPLLGEADVGYHLHGVAVQSWWVIGLAAVLLALGVPAARRAAVVGLLAASGLVYLNTVYTRPGMLSAALALLTLAVVLSRRVSMPLAASGTLAGVVFLAHGSTLVVFASMLPLALLAWRRVSRHPYVDLALGVVALVACATPWLIFQSRYDPPGDRLTKYYLAGVTAASDERSLGEAITDRYGELNVGEIASNKVDNLLAYVRGEPGFPGWYPWDSFVHDVRSVQIFTVLGAVGILLAGSVHAFRAARGSPALRWVWFVVGSNLLLTALLHFGSPLTLPIPLKLGFTPILLAGGLMAAAVLEGPRWLAALVAGVQLTTFVWLWVVDLHRNPLFSDPVPGWDLVAGTTATVAIAALVALAVRPAADDGEPLGARDPRHGVGR